MADGGIGEAALLASLGGAAAAADIPMTAAAFGSAAMPAGLGGLLAGGLGAGAADEAVGSAAGAGPANPLSLGFGNMMSQYGKPGLSALGTAGRLYGAGNAVGGALGVPGLGQQSAMPPPMRPPGMGGGMPQPAASSALGSQFSGGAPPAGPMGGAAGLVGARMGGMAPAGGMLSPQMLQMLQAMMAQRGGMS